MKSYEGYRSWNASNVSLWLNNDENYYRLGRDIVEHVIDKWDRNPLHGQIYSNQEKIEIATGILFDKINKYNWRNPKILKTPDGASFNHSSLKIWIESQFEGEPESELYQKIHSK